LEGSADWQSTHHGLSEIDFRFREMAKSSPDFLERSRFHALERNRELTQYRLQPWVTFLGSGKLEELKRVSLGVNNLIKNISELIFHEDWVKMAEFYHLGSPSIAEIVFSSPTDAKTVFSRGDFIDTAGGFKCIEFNFAPNLGGWDTSIITRMHLSVPATSSFIAREGISVHYTDPIWMMFRHIFADLRDKQLASDGNVTIAFVVQPWEVVPEDNPKIMFFQREMNRAIETLGLEISGKIVSCSYQDMAPREPLFLGARRVDALIELSNIMTPTFIYRLFKGGCVALYNGPVDRILGSKRNLALLSQYAASRSFSDAERDMIESHIPWTRLVSPDLIDYEGGTHPLYDLVAAHQDRFVLKKADSFGGKDVFIGRSTASEEWGRRLDTALAQGGWIVQEVQESLPYLYQSGEYGCSVHDLVWGPFCFGDAYGGVVLRMQPRASGGAVNLSLNATEGIVLEV